MRLVSTVQSAAEDFGLLAKNMQASHNIESLVNPLFAERAFV
jgi:hypothetical protein